MNTPFKPAKLQEISEEKDFFKYSDLRPNHPGFNNDSPQLNLKMANSNKFRFAHECSLLKQIQHSINSKIDISIAIA